MVFVYITELPTQVFNAAVKFATGFANIGPMLFEKTVDPQEFRIVKVTGIVELGQLVIS